MSERVSAAERSGARDQSKQCGASKRESSASEGERGASGQASDTVLPPVILAHSVTDLVKEKTGTTNTEKSRA